MLFILKKGELYYAGIEYKLIRNVDGPQRAAKFNEIEARARAIYLERTYGERYEVVALPEVQECRC